MAYLNYSGVLLPDSAPANNWITGMAATEVLNGTPNNDSFNPVGGFDTIYGGAGDDYYWLSDGRQQVIEQPGQGVDTVNIWSSYVLPANVENLVINNTNAYGAGNDGDNIIQGGDGPQYIYGGKGEDVLIGGGGGDTFVVLPGEGDKVIQDFQPGLDKLRLQGSGFATFGDVQAHMAQQGSDVVINDQGTMIALRNMTVGQLSAGDFQLPFNYAALGAPTFDDEFDTLSIGPTGKWWTNWGDGLYGHTLINNQEAEIYSDGPSFAGSGTTPLGINPFSDANGVATITANPTTPAQQAALWGYKWDSGMLMSSYTQLYGYFEIRAQLPHGQGLWPAFWLSSGVNEIDVLEGLGSDTKVPFNAIHSPTTPPGVGVANFLPHDDGFHTYGTLWSAQNIVFYVDGTEVWRIATPADMNVPMHIIANLALGGQWAGLPDSTTPFPAQMNIDYIRAYNLPDPNYAGGVSTSPPGVVAASPPPTSPPPVSPPPVSATTTTATTGFIGGAGADTLTASVGGHETMTGGAGNDVFAFNTVPWQGDHITDFAAGADRLDFSALFAASHYTGADPIADGFVKLYDDGTGTWVIYDTDGKGSADPWGTSVVHLDGVVAAGLTSAALFGGAAAASPPPVSPPPVSPPPVTTTSSGGLQLTSHGQGDVVTGTAGADTITGSTGGDTLTGGAGADDFVFPQTPWTPSHITDFQLGVDRLDVSKLFLNGYAGADPVKDGYVFLVSDGSDGTAVVVNPYGPGGAEHDYVVDLQHVNPAGLTSAQVFGGASPSAVSSAATVTTAGVTLTATHLGDTLTGTAGNDTLVGSRGYDVLSGGAGDDRFVFAAEPWAPETITDFQHGHDVLDLAGMFQAVGYQGSDPVADHYLSFISDGAGGAAVLFDPDGAGTAHPWPDYVIDLKGVDPATMTASDWIVR